MKIFRTSLFRHFQNFLYALGGGMIVFLLLLLILEKLIPIKIGFIIGLVTGLVTVAVIFYFLFIRNSIRFELYPDGTFKYFKRDKLQNTLTLSHYYITWNCRTESNELGDRSDIELKLLRKQNFLPISIKAGSLGKKGFDKMFAEMLKFTAGIAWKEAEKFTKRY